MSIEKASNFVFFENLGLNLENALREYKNNSTDSELLTKFIHSFWTEVGKKIGKTIIVDKFLLTSKEIKERQVKGDMAIFDPDGVGKEDLGIMFPNLDSWALREGNSIVDITNNSGWLWIEASVDSPNRKINKDELEEKFKKEGKQGQSLKSYIIGSIISKLITGKFFDEGPTWTRLLGSSDSDVDRILECDFGIDGRLGVGPTHFPWERSKSSGGRSEEVIKF